MHNQECETHSQSEDRQQSILFLRHYKTLTDQLELRNQRTTTSGKIIQATERNDGKTSSLSSYWVVASFLGGTVASFHTACQASSRSNPTTPFLTASAMRESAWVPIMILVSAMFFHIGSQPLWMINQYNSRSERVYVYLLIVCQHGVDKTRNAFGREENLPCPCCTESIPNRIASIWFFSIFNMMNMTIVCWPVLHIFVLLTGVLERTGNSSVKYLLLHIACTFDPESIQFLCPLSPHICSSMFQRPNHQPVPISHIRDDIRYLKFKVLPRLVDGYEWSTDPGRNNGKFLGRRREEGVGAERPTNTMVYVSLDLITLDDAMPLKFSIKSYAEEPIKVAGRFTTRNGCNNIVLTFSIITTDLLLPWRNDDKPFRLGSVGRIRTPDGGSGNININVGRVNDIGSVETDTEMGSAGGWSTWISSGVWNQKMMAN